MKKGILFLFLLGIRICVSAQDRTLDFYVQQAQAGSPLLKDYQHQAESISVDSQLIRASYRPQVNGISNNVYAPVIHGFGYDNAISNGGQLSAQVQVSKTFAGNNNLAAQFQTLSLDKNTIVNNAGIARRDLKKTVTAQYIVAYGDMVTMNFNKETLTLLQKEEGLLKSLTESNVYKQSDYLTFYVTLQQQQLIFRQSEIQFRNDLAQLNYLCGIIDTSLAVLPDPALQPGVIPEASGSILYRQFFTDSLKNINQREVIRHPGADTFGLQGFLSAAVWTADSPTGPATTCY